MKLMASPCPGAIMPSEDPSGYSSLSSSSNAFGLSKKPLRMMGFWALGFISPITSILGLPGSALGSAFLGSLDMTSKARVLFEFSPGTLPLYLTFSRTCTLKRSILMLRSSATFFNAKSMRYPRKCSAENCGVPVKARVTNDGLKITSTTIAGWPWLSTSFLDGPTRTGICKLLSPRLSRWSSVASIPVDPCARSTNSFAQTFTKTLPEASYAAAEVLYDLTQNPAIGTRS
mmetsp:Transcript_12685/g.24060  ORF Transcript_12685/g.24060 Transcript_12685/m.24060 type:complete len:231 (+) Transcript_12685:875-1567(+)